MRRRITGKASFAEIQDSEGTFQLYLNRDELCPDEDKTMYNTIFKKLLDRGDFIGIEGETFKTRVGEPSVKVTALAVLSKAIRPLPAVKTDEEGNVHDAFTDPELRYRQRYVDLVVNPDVKNTFIARSKIIRKIREVFDAMGWMEVDTPVLQSIPGGAAAQPFITRHNALGCDFYLRIALELYLKRLLVGGMDRVFEIGRNYRNEGISPRHNPEFTMLEAYQAFGDYETMMELL